MRTLAIDLGTRRIGLAISDAGGSWATPLDVITVTDAAQAVPPVLAVVKREDVRRVVVGLPLNMDGTVGPAARDAVRWAAGLAASAGSAGTPFELLFVDERLSSFDAEQRLNDRKRAGERLTRKRRKEQLDAVAAAGFLQGYLDGRLQAIDVGG